MYAPSSVACGPPALDDLGLAAALKVISKRLRYSSPSFTSNRYGDVLPELTRAAAEATAAVVPRRRGRTATPA